MQDSPLDSRSQMSSATSSRPSHSDR